LDEKIVRLVDSLTRDFVNQIPAPPAPDVSPGSYELQVASFLEKERARKTADLFVARGVNSRIQIVDIGGKEWHRIILGPYYLLSAAEADRALVTRMSEFIPILIHHPKGLPGPSGRDHNYDTPTASESL
jgi:cell division protein FtsN